MAYSKEEILYNSSECIQHSCKFPEAINMNFEVEKFS